ncbi:MAG: rhomboid family intramembrane serine protease [Bacteroidales bacterium]|jgi:membrane associated rhomboid family serine protease|nr:rhomboid family intramembrane serine protease [Bacteroidales bacterium]
MAYEGNEYHVGGFRILPPVVKNLLIINGLFFLATIALNGFGIDLTNALGLHFITAKSFHIYQLLTYQFMHGGFSHVFFNMFALWMFGSALENYWGGKRFLIYYLITGIGAGLTQELVWYIDLRDLLASSAEIVNMAGRHISKMQYIDRYITVGASGSVYGLLLAFGMLFPNVMIYIYFFIPIRAKWFVIVFGVIELISGITSTGGDIAHFAHLGGMIFGFLLIKFWQRQQKKRYKNSAYWE